MLASTSHFKGKKRRRRKKIPLCTHVHPREQERLFARTYGAKCPEVNGNMLCLAKSFRDAEKEKQRPGEEPGQKWPPEPAQGAGGVRARRLPGQAWRLCTCEAAALRYMQPQKRINYICVCVV